MFNFACNGTDCCHSPLRFVIVEVKANNSNKWLYLSAACLPIRSSSGGVITRKTTNGKASMVALPAACGGGQATDTQNIGGGPDTLKRLTVQVPHNQKFALPELQFINLTNQQN
ncbi:hypothetical protein J6590_058684 [Homalodisca vitripennis]|nr:hypothetical protein J6590_058684 [Homalodisca vitripennis]